MRTRTIVMLVLILSLIVLVSSLLVLKNRGVGAIQNSLKLIPQPEPFTELYFQNASSLPRSVGAMKQISFSFVISNVEYTTTTYPYEVYFEYPNGRQVNIVSGNVTLSSNTSTTIPVLYTFPTSNLVGRVVVNLPTLNNQAIDFLLASSNNNQP